MIRSVRSNFDTFLASLPGLALRVGELATRASEALSDQNVAALSHLLANLDRASATLPHFAARRGRTRRRPARRDGRGEGSDRHAAPLRPRRQPRISPRALRRLRDASDNLARVSDRLDAMIAENRGDVRGFMRDGLPQLEGLVEDGGRRRANCAGSPRSCAAIPRASSISRPRAAWRSHDEASQLRTAVAPLIAGVLLLAGCVGLRSGAPADQEYALEPLMPMPAGGAGAGIDRRCSCPSRDRGSTPIGSSWRTKTGGSITMRRAAGPRACPRCFSRSSSRPARRGALSHRRG